MGDNWWWSRLASIASLTFLSKKMSLKMTCPTLLVMRVPPEAPVTSLTPPSLSTMTVGTMDERGVFPGMGKLLGEGGTPKLLVMPG